MKIRRGHVANSSTTCFLCDTTESVEQVKDFIDEALRLVEGDDTDTEPRRYNAICTVEPYTRAISDDLDGWRNYYSIPTPREGMVCIMGTDDNSIPWEIQEIIENHHKLGATRLHLG